MNFLEYQQDEILRKIKTEQDMRNMVRSKTEYEQRSLLLEKIKGKRKPDPEIMREISNLNAQIEEGRQLRDPDLVKAGAEAQLVYYRL